MYTRLTKTAIIDGRECVTCIFYGTNMCHHIHNNVVDCGHCEVFAAILNQLHAFEDIVFDVQQEDADQRVEPAALPERS